MACAHCDRDIGAKEWMNVFPVNGRKLLLVRPGCYITSSAQRGAREGNLLERPWKKLNCVLFAEELERRRRQAPIPV